MSYTKERALDDYKCELNYALKLKGNCFSEVSALVAGRIANGRSQVPIDEYIKMLEDSITAIKDLPEGASAEEFNY
jgi:hypothetical protein